MAKKSLGTALKEEIAKKAFADLDMPLALAARVDKIFDDKLGNILTSLGGAMESRLGDAIRDKYADGISNDTRTDIVNALGESLAKRLGGAIVDELKQPGILTDEKKLGAALDTLAEGFSQFAPDDIEAIFKKSVGEAFKGADAAMRKREAEESEKLAISRKIEQMDETIRELRAQVRTLKSEKSDLEDTVSSLRSSSRVAPSYSPPSRSYGGGSSYGGKFAQAAKAADMLDLTKAVKEAFPEATQEQLKAGLANPEFLTAMHGPMPPQSTLSAPVVQVVKTATAGSFVVCHGHDKGGRASSTKPTEELVAIVKRNDKGPNGEDRFSVLGGYVNLGSDDAAGEQPAEASVRALKQKVINAEGMAILAPDVKRLVGTTRGIDYSKSLPLRYDGHALELNTREMAQLKEHSRRLHEDEKYREAVKEKAGALYTDVSLVPISEALKMERESFARPFEFDAVQELAKDLKQKAAQRPRT